MLVDLKPSGQHYMEDLNKAGGLVPVLRALADKLDLDCMTVTGRTLGDEIAAAPAPWTQDVVRERDDPIYPEGGIAVLRGNLAPDGAIIKQSAATPALCQHTGRAGGVRLRRRPHGPDRRPRPRRRAGGRAGAAQRPAPRARRACPRLATIPIPKKLATQGVTDMMRLSDARMSGTAFGTIVLHACPEAAIGGPLALVENGDRITLDVAGARAHAGRAAGDAGCAPGSVAAPAPAGGRGARLSRVASRPRRAGRPRLRIWIS